MKHLKTLAIVAISGGLIISACTPTTTTTTDTLVGNWVTQSELNGSGRVAAVSFVINDNDAYIGTGFSAAIRADQRFQDLWKYNATNNSWQQCAKLPGAARSNAVAFAVGTKGYIATGNDGNNLLQDTWEYNSLTNAWTQKSNLPDQLNGEVGSGARRDAVGFAIGNKGYVFGGFNGSNQKDIWAYDPATDKWTETTSIGGQKRQGSNVMVYNNKAYIVAGSNNGSLVYEMWQFDPSNTENPWKQLRKITNISTETYDDGYTTIGRTGAASFVMGAKGYLVNGDNGGYMKTVWEYDFATDAWTRKNDFEYKDRIGSVGFSVKGRGFVTCGRNGNDYLSDLVEFKPTETLNAAD